MSDGQANRGETEPEVLTRLAGDLAERGVTNSCVGIGRSYSPLQLNAIADIWMTRHGYDAMMLNEQGLYEEATGVFDFDKERFADFTSGLKEAGLLKEQREVVREYSSQEWRGKSKLEALSMSKKAMCCKPDFRRKRSESRWTDFKPD